VPKLWKTSSFGASNSANLRVRAANWQRGRRKLAQRSISDEATQETSDVW